MAQPPADPPPSTDRSGEDGGGPNRGALVALVVIVLLVVGTLFVMKRIHSADAIQDCVASGRTNCAPVQR
jgi:hypothetical protein